MQIQVRENINNSGNNQRKKIDVNLPDKTTTVDGEEISWSFVEVSSDTNIYHSTDAAEGTFLNYLDPLSPDMEILMETYGTCTIKLICCLSYPEDKIVENRELDENGNIITSEETIQIYRKETFESDEIILNYVEISENAWI